MRFWRRRVVNRRRTAREDQPLGRSRIDCFNWRVEGKNLAVNARFSHATSDELCVLRSEVKYYYGFMLWCWLIMKRKEWLIILS